MTLWNDSLLIGFDSIDRQHQELVSRVEQHMDACRAGKGHTEVEETLRFIVSYVKEHFKDEEALQVQYSYPEIGEHKKLHQDFIVTVVGLVQEFQNHGIQSDFTTKMNKTLVEWLVKHIRTEDKKLAVHIQKIEGY